MKQQQISLGELALELKLNKSRLAYYFSIGLIFPITKVGRMNVFSYQETIKNIKKIEKLQAEGKTLKEIKEKLG